MPLFLLLLILFGVALLIPTAYAGFIGAPYAPTRQPAINKAFKLIGLGQDDFVIDLGAGDGKVLLSANSVGAKAVGYELSPIMWFVSWLRVVKNNETIKIRLRNFYKQKLPPETTVVFAFLMPDNMPRLKTYLAKQNLPRAKYLLSYVFPFKDVAPEQIVRTPKSGAVYIYDLKDLVASSK
ncbi:MAG: hypothetical protein Q8P73_04895 [bacterium]|nr:hypothetical protein [bacterium]MDZ4341433.1 hypothetical protein [Candidatus Binatia bacterium]